MSTARKSKTNEQLKLPHITSSTKNQSVPKSSNKKKAVFVVKSPDKKLNVSSDQSSSPLKTQELSNQKKLPVITNSPKSSPKAEKTIISAQYENSLTEDSTEKIFENVESQSKCEISSQEASLNHDAPNPCDEKVKIYSDGNVTLKYEQYEELFPVVSGSTTQENIDDVYALTFVMPNCRIRLSKYNNQEHRQRVIDQNLVDLYTEENPIGTYQKLDDGETYYIYVEQCLQQLELDHQHMRESLRANLKSNEDLKKNNGRVLESCSCIYGNPCVDEYGCKDWANRYAIATKNGWKGF